MKLLLLLLGGAKFGKLLTTAGTMLLSLGAYALIWGWRYAAGFVALHKKRIANDVVLGYSGEA